MGYMLYSLAFLTLAVGTTLYMLRAHWIHHLPSSFSLPSNPLYHAIPTTFRDDIEAGLHSTDFDLTANVEGDERAGLDDKGRKEVLRIMKRRGVGFDEARRLLMQERFAKAGVGLDGVPSDPKFVSFS
ncbi:hypothetical protein C7974DRAFT_414742 [Boeremia exigua]|uniref:uncharacterized protein n=1 Tax=Boeremia exigua TaxID=749465 RepID=UPI001E8D1E1B|nr:uncharacterized protein C7974DRAFT_414742 [Boeremia exigua]KAH6622070.1 hypothetical protein C7974DRAFT_414742 [Boeremia exigua]